MNAEEKNGPKKKDETVDDFIDELEGSLDDLFAETDDGPPAAEQQKTPAPDLTAEKQPTTPKQKTTPQKPAMAEKKPAAPPVAPPKQKAAKPDETAVAKKPVQPKQTVVVVKKQTGEPQKKTAGEKAQPKVPEKKTQKSLPLKPAETPPAAKKPAAQPVKISSPPLTAREKPAETEKTAGVPPDLRPKEQVVDLDRAERGPLRFRLIAGGVVILIAAVVVYLFFMPKKTDEFRAPPTRQAVQKISPPTVKAVKPPPVEAPLQPAPAPVAAKPPPAEPTAPEKAHVLKKETPSAAEEINLFLTRWKTGWEKSAGKTGDIAAYMSFYADRFVSGKWDKAGWAKDKAAKNRRKDWIKIALSDIRIAGPLAGGDYLAEFTQDYRSSNYSGVSTKTLLLTKEETGWKILSNQVKIASRPYSIHAGSYRSKADAEQSIKSIRRMGLQAFRVETDLGDKGVWHRVFIGCYQTQKTARQVIAGRKLEGARPEKTQFASHLGAFVADDRLNGRIRNLEAKGFSPYVIRDDFGRHHLYAGAFVSRTDALAFNQTLLAEGIVARVASR